MSLEPLIKKNKDFLICLLIIPSVIIGIWGVVGFAWHNFVFAFFIPIFPTIWFIEPKFTRYYALMAMKIFQFRKWCIFEYRFRHNLTNKDFILKYRSHYSKRNTWIYACLIPCMLAFSFSGFIDTEVSRYDEPFTQLSSIAMVSLFFFIPCFFIGITLSIIDSSNLMQKNNRGEVTLVSKNLIKIIPIISLVLTFSQLFYFGSPEHADIYRFAVVAVVFHSAAIVYMTFFQKPLVQQFRMMLRDEGIRIE